MNAIAKIEDAHLSRQPFDRAHDSVNAWRGKCLHAFTCAEAAVTETLLVLSEVPEKGNDVKLPHLVGQRFEALETALSPDAAIFTKGSNIAEALADFRIHEPLRVMLCHGVGKVTVDRKGKWTFVVRTLALRSKKPSRNVRVIEEDEACEIAKNLARSSQKLCDELRNLRKKFPGGAPGRD